MGFYVLLGFIAFFVLEAVWFTFEGWRVQRNTPPNPHARYYGGRKC